MFEYVEVKKTMATLAFVVVLSLTATCAAQDDGRDQLAFSRAEHLRHGINASIWFAQHPSDYSAERLRSFTTPEDIALMQTAWLRSCAPQYRRRAAGCRICEV